MRVHPSTPNGEKIQAAIRKFAEEHLGPYAEPGNLIGRNLYVDLPLPWTLAEPVAEFDESTFFRKEWNTDRSAADGDEFFAAGRAPADLDTMEKMLATASPVTRWREAHPEAVGTERDVVRMVRREIERLLRDAGVEPGNAAIKGGMAGVLLMVKKKA